MGNWPAYLNKQAELSPPHAPLSRGASERQGLSPGKAHVDVERGHDGNDHEACRRED